MVTIKRKVQILEKKPQKNSNRWIILSIVGLCAILIFGIMLLTPSRTEYQVKTNANESNKPINSSPASSSISEVENELAKTNTGNTSKGISPSVTPPAVSNQNKPAIDLPYKKGKAYKIYLFPFGDANYSQPNPELDKLVEVMKKNSSMKISIAAYTDNVGDVNYNQQLSEQRAKAILNYLVSRGIEQNRISSQGKGVSTDFSSNAENRRAEFILS